MSIYSEVNELLDKKNEEIIKLLEENEALKEQLSVYKDSMEASGVIYADTFGKFIRIKDVTSIGSIEFENSQPVRVLVLPWEKGGRDDM